MVTVGVGVGAPPRPPGLVLGLVYAGRIEHLVAEAGRPPALPRRPHRSLRRAWAWQGAVGGALSTVGGACTRGNAKKRNALLGLDCVSCCERRARPRIL